jgi:putative flippase GtrA
MCEIINKIKQYYPEIIRLIKFLFVGGVGMLINLGLLFLFTEIFGFYYMISAIIAAFINVTYNFLANRFWSFSDRDNVSLISGYTKFVVTMGLYSIVYYILLYVLTEFVFDNFSFYFVKGYMISAILSTIVATVPKYIMCFAWVFPKKKVEKYNEKS